MSYGVESCCNEVPTHLDMFVILLGDEGMTLLNSYQVIKSLACIEFYVANNSIEDQLNRFLALHALVEGLGIG